jgi:diguanylate cyclase (GGDEF)-like protein/PAS domain S-box-containing protein
VDRPTRRDPLILTTVSVAALVIAVLLVVPFGDVARLRVFWTVQPLADLAMFGLSRQVMNSATHRPQQRFWRAMSFAGASIFLGDLSQVAFAWIRPGLGLAVLNPFQIGLTIVGVVAVVWVMLTYPIPRATRGIRIRFWLDAAAVTIGTAVFVWFLVIPDHGNGHERIGELAGSTILVVAAFAAIKVLLSGAPVLRPAAAPPVVAAAAIQGYFIGVMSDDPASYRYVLAGQTLAALFMVVGIRLQHIWPDRVAGRTTDRPRRRYGLLPYVTLFSMFALLPVVLRGGLSGKAWVVIGGLMLVTGLVVVRQVLALNENALLVHRLDHSLDELRSQEERMRSLLANATDITSVVDEHGVLVYVTPSSNRVLGKAPAEVIGTPVLSHLHPDDRIRLLDSMMELQSTPNSTLTYQARFAHSDGSWRWLEVFSRNLRLVPSVAGVVSNARDVTEARHLEEQLRHRATHDVLTGLANRGLFDERLAESVRAGTTAVLLIDLDDFKFINDTYGHHAGDTVLIGVADRLRRCLPPHGTAARIGGDEFAVLLPGMDDAGARRTASRFHTLLEQPMVVDGRPLRARASVGVVSADTNDAETLLRSADAAMYRAKRTSHARRAA